MAPRRQDANRRRRARVLAAAAAADVPNPSMFHGQIRRYKQLHHFIAKALKRQSLFRKRVQHQRDRRQHQLDSALNMLSLAQQFMFSPSCERKENNLTWLTCVAPLIEVMKKKASAGAVMNRSRRMEEEDQRAIRDNLDAAARQLTSIRIHDQELKDFYMACGIASQQSSVQSEQDAEQVEAAEDAEAAEEAEEAENADQSEEVEEAEEEVPQVVAHDEPLRGASQGWYSEDDARVDDEDVALDDDASLSVIVGRAFVNNDHESSASSEDPRLARPWPWTLIESVFVPVGAYNFEPMLGAESCQLYLYTVGFWFFDEEQNCYVEAMCYPRKQVFLRGPMHQVRFARVAEPLPWLEGQPEGRVQYHLVPFKQAIE